MGRQCPLHDLRAGRDDVLGRVDGDAEPGDGGGRGGGGRGVRAPGHVEGEGQGARGGGGLEGVVAVAPVEGGGEAPVGVVLGGLVVAVAAEQRVLRGQAGGTHEAGACEAGA